MIYHPKVKSRGVAFSPDPGFGDTGIMARDLISLTENSLRSPSAVLEALAQTDLSWVSEVSTGSETIKYSDPPDDLYREIRTLQKQIDKRATTEVAAWRKRKNAAVAAIRKSLTETIPVYKYRKEWRVKDITYVKKLRLPRSLGLAVYNSGTTYRYGTPEYERLVKAAETLNPFDKVYVVRITVEKTIGYWANVAYVAKTRKIIRDRKALHDRIADWVSKNPPYRASKDASLAADRQRLYSLKLRRSGQYNQCAACKDISAVGRITELRSACRTMLAQYLVDPSVAPLDSYVSYMSALHGQTFMGFVVKEEWWREPYESDGNIVEGQWVTGRDFLSKWEEAATGKPFELNFPMDNDTYATALVGNEDLTVRHMIDGRVWPCVPGLSPFEVSNATDNAVLNVQAGGKNPFEWNFARSALELKDSSATYKTARDFLRQIAGGKFKAMLTVKAAASAYLTYKFGIEPTAADLGQLLGTSRSLLKHTYPTLRTLAAYAEGAAAATITGRSAISFGTIDYKSLFSGKMDVEYPFSELHIHSIWHGKSSETKNYGTTHVLSSDVPFAARPKSSLRGNRTYITQGQWDILESRNVAPKWVWVPESGVAFQRYSAEKVRLALGTSFSDILLSLDSLTTGWEVLPLSFVVDWFTNVRSSLQAMDNFIHASRLELSPDGEGAWYSMRYRLMLACPIYRKEGKPTDYFVHYGYRLTEEERNGEKDIRHKLTVLKPLAGSIRMTADLVGVNLLETGVKAYARNLLDGAPLTALLPRLEVSLNAGKLSSLLAMLLS